MTCICGHEETDHDGADGECQADHDPMLSHLQWCDCLHYEEARDCWSWRRAEKGGPA